MEARAGGAEIKKKEKENRGGAVAILSNHYIQEILSCLWCLEKHY